MSRLYTLDQPLVSSSPTYNTVSLIPPSNTILWYHRIGHLNFQSLYHLTKERLVDGVPILPHIKGLCSTYVEAKQTKEKIPHLSLF